jgi:preprotein translocase subunit SecG
MYTVLVVIHVLVAFAICGVVLLQAGKGADIGSAFGGAGTQAVFGSMGTPTLLTKITGVVAFVFMLTSFGLTILGGTERASIVRPVAPTAPAAPAPPAK